MSDKLIRKALETRLDDVLVVGGLLTPDQIQWPNIDFTRDALLPPDGPGFYIRPTYHPGPNRAMTLGPTPRIQQNGLFKVGVNVVQSYGEDITDDLTDAIKAAFAYGLELTNGGIRVEITRHGRGDAVSVDGWYYAPVDIYWSVWRAT